MNQFVPGDRERDFAEALFRRALAVCADTPPAGSDDLESFGTARLGPQVAIVRKALLRLSVEDRAPLLLRDQCHLPFDRIASVLGKNERLVRSDCLKARERLRAVVEGILEEKEPPHAV